MVSQEHDWPINKIDRILKKVKKDNKREKISAGYAIDMSTDLNFLLDRNNENIESVSSNGAKADKAERLKKLGATQTEIQEEIKKLELKIQPAKESTGFNAVPNLGATLTSSSEILDKLSPEIVQSTPVKESLDLAVPDDNLPGTLDDSSQKLFRELAKRKSNKDSADSVEVNTEPFDISPVLLNNYKTAALNEQIYDHLIMIGEPSIAQHLNKSMNPEKVPEMVSSVQDNTKAVRHVSKINERLQENLASIAYVLRDRQDIEVESVQDKLTNEAEAERIIVQNTIQEESSGSSGNWLMSTLGRMFGRPLIKLLTGLGSGAMSITRLATRLLGAGIGFLKNTLGSWVLDMGKKAAGLAMKAGGMILSGGKWVVNKGLDAVDSISGRKDKFNIGKDVKPDVPSKPDTPGKAVKPDVPSKLDTPGKDVKPDVPSKPDTPGKAVKPKSTGFWGSVSEKLDSAKKSVGNTVDKAVDNVKMAGKKVSEFAGGVYKKGKYAASHSLSSLKTMSKKAVSSGLLKTGAKFASKFLRFIPFIGPAIQAGMSAYAMYDGYTNAETVYGIPQDELTLNAKLTSGVAHVIDDLLFGAAPTSLIAKGLMTKSGATLVNQDGIDKGYDGVDDDGKLTTGDSLDFESVLQSVGGLDLPREITGDQQNQPDNSDELEDSNFDSVQAEPVPSNPNEEQLDLMRDAESRQNQINQTQINTVNELANATNVVNSAESDNGTPSIRPLLPNQEYAF